MRKTCPLKAMKALIHFAILKLEFFIRKEQIDFKD